MLNTGYMELYITVNLILTSNWNPNLTIVHFRIPVNGEFYEIIPVCLSICFFVCQLRVFLGNRSLVFLGAFFHDGR